MDRNQITGWVLIVGLVIGFVYFQSNNLPEELPEEQKSKEEQVDTPDSKTVQPNSSNQAAEKPAAPNGAVAVESPDTSLADSIRNAIENERLKADYGLFYESANGADEELVVENDVLRLHFSNKGGYIKKAVLKKYRTYQDYMADEQGELILFEGDSSFYQLNFSHQNRTLDTRQFYFAPSLDESSIKLEEGKDLKLTYRLTASNGGYIEFAYRLKSNEYMLDFDVNVVNLDRDITGVGGAIEFKWEQATPTQEKSIELERDNATIFYYSEEEGRDWLSERSEDQSENVEEALSWLSFKQQYFSSVLIAKDSKIRGAKISSRYNEEDSSYVKMYASSFPVEMSSNTSQKMNLYLGPNEYDQLSSYDLHLQDQLNLGWGIFRWVNQYFMYPVFQLLLKTGMGIGLGIILLTFAIKLILFPITYKNFLSSAKMRVIKPHLEKINEENKDADPLKKQQATMELYKKTGVNPLAGCIPALLQMPILIALYRLFPTAIELRHQPFLWAEDLSTYDEIFSWTTQIPVISSFYGNHVSLFTLLMAISMFFYMRYNQQMTPGTAASGGGDMQEAIQSNMKLMMNLMPVMMLFMFNGFAAGLSFYYFLANMITIVQTLVIKKWIINEDKILDKINLHMAKPMQKSKWQKRLDELQKKQQGFKK